MTLPALIMRKLLLLIQIKRRTRLEAEIEDLIQEPITRIVVGADDGLMIIYTPVYQLIIEPWFLPDGTQDGVEYTISKGGLDA